MTEQPMGECRATCLTCDVLLGAVPCVREADHQKDGGNVVGFGAVHLAAYPEHEVAYRCVTARSLETEAKREEKTAAERKEKTQRVMQRTNERIAHRLEQIRQQENNG
jgi:hypothetical protein